MKSMVVVVVVTVGSLPASVSDATAAASIESLAHRARQFGIAGVNRLTRLQEEQMNLFISDRAVANPSRDHEQLPWAQHDIVVILQADAELASRDEEELVGLIVLVPHEFASGLDHLDIVVVDGGHDLGAPVVVEASELHFKVHLAGQPVLLALASSECQPSPETRLSSITRARTQQAWV
jgi:hypothetical protein